MCRRAVRRAAVILIAGRLLGCAITCGMSGCMLDAVAKVCNGKECRLASEKERNAKVTFCLLRWKEFFGFIDVS